MPHSLVSNKTATSLHTGMEFNMTKFKAMNSDVKTLMRKVCVARFRVARWHGKMDLEVVSLDVHSVTLGQDFLQLAHAVSVSYASRLVFLGESGAWSM